MGKIKIFTVGYYDDFARFFLALKKEIKKENNKIEFKYLSIYLSGFFYFLIRFEQVSFFSLKIEFNKILKNNFYKKTLSKNDSFYKGLNLEKIVSYHVFLDNKNKNKYKLQALSYIDVVESYFKNNKIDMLFLSGDTRMCIEIFDYFARQYNIQTFYFEQGPFGTTIWDAKGVNANASIRGVEVEDSKLSLKELNNKINSFFKRDRPAKYKRNPLYRGSDYIFQSVTKSLGLFPIDITIDKNSKCFSDVYKSLKDEKPNQKCFLLILQVPLDVNMTHHSSYFKNHFSIVENVHKNLPDGYTLIVREHPLYKNRYEAELYEYMKDNNICIDKEELYNSMKKADVVIVNNSTVGIEAISLLKKVVCLGNSYYDNSGICLKLKENVSLRKLLENALNFDVDEKKVLNFLNYFLFNFLIDGHYRDEELKAIKEISKIILKEE